LLAELLYEQQEPRGRSPPSNPPEPFSDRIPSREPFGGGEKLASPEEAPRRSPSLDLKLSNVT
jgi:hypothetical protein